MYQGKYFNFLTRHLENDPFNSRYERRYAPVIWVFFEFFQKAS